MKTKSIYVFSLTVILGLTIVLLCWIIISAWNRTASTPITTTPTTKPIAPRSPTTDPTPTPSPTPATTRSPTSTATSNPNQTPSSTVQPVWSSDARISSLSQLGIQYGVHGNGSPNDAVTIVSAPSGISPSGTKAFQLTTNDDRVEFDIYPGSLIQNDFYFSWWTYVPNSVTTVSKSQWLNIFELEGSIPPYWDPIYSITISSWQAGNNVILYGRDNSNNEYPPNNGVLADSGTTLPRDQWVHLEFYCHIGTNGSFQAWMNGAQLWNVSGVDTSGLHQATMYFLPCLFGTSGTLYVDNMALYDVNIKR